MTSVNRITQTIARLEDWRRRRELKRLDVRIIKRAVDLLCSYRNLLKEHDDARRD